MNEKQYYIHRTSCRIHSKKTADLSQLLQRFDYSTVTFTDTFTPQTLLDWLNAQVKEINTRHPYGYQVEVRMTNWGNVCYCFTDSPKATGYVAQATLLPVKRNIDGTTL